jgi:PAS domain S-box-containing protein
MINPAEQRLQFRGWLVLSSAFLGLSAAAVLLVSYMWLDYSQAPSSTRVTVLAGVAVLFGCGATILIRSALKLERDLVAAREDVARQQAAHQHVADNLPIGLYTYTPENIDTSNLAWDRLVGWDKDQDRWSVFVSRLHPEDRERVIATYQRAEMDLNPFGIAYRLQMPEGSTRHVETRAVAVKTPDGDLEHIVGFLVDISSRVRAQRLLEDKNREVQESNDMLRKALTEIEDNFEAMVHSLVKAVEAKDPYTAGHSERVMEYSLRIGERLGLSEDEMRVLKMGTLIHDIGKIGIPDAILTKPDHLTDDEYSLIKQHPTLGYKMIESIPTFSECLPIVLHHHERLDGKGYPFGLKGLEIPLLVRICSVSDSFDAMTSDRAYRKGLDPQIAIEELLVASDRKIVDRHVVGVLADIINEEGLSPLLNASVA